MQFKLSKHNAMHSSCDPTFPLFRVIGKHSALLVPDLINEKPPGTGRVVRDIFCCCCYRYYLKQLTKRKLRVYSEIMVMRVCEAFALNRVRILGEIFFFWGGAKAYACVYATKCYISKHSWCLHVPRPHCFPADSA